MIRINPPRAGDVPVVFTIAGYTLADTAPDQTTVPITLVRHAVIVAAVVALGGLTAGGGGRR